jgi:tetratricopeptide (TPR) repeat protein
MSSPNNLNRLLTKTKVKVILIIILTVVVFFPALFAGFIWDDIAVYDNPVLQSIDGLWKIWIIPYANFREPHYWPIVYTVFWFECRLWANNPFGYHLINVLLHAVNVVLLWHLLQRMNFPGAGLTAIIFAVHPVHVESVAWIIECKDVLSAFFYLLSFQVYLNYQNQKSWINYLLSLFLFICALLSKSMTVSLPIAILIYLWWEKGTIKKNDFLSLLPFIITAIILLSIDIKLAQQDSALTSFTLTPLQRFIVAGKSLWFYLGKLFWPTNLLTIYPRWNLEHYSIVEYLYPILFLMLLLLLYIGKRYFGRGPFTALFYFFLTVAPVLGFIDFSFMYHSFVADRFLYLPSIGPIMLFGTFANNIYQRSRIIYKPILRITGILLVAILSFFTWKQAELYNNNETLFRYNIAKNPYAWQPYNGLGWSLLEQNRFAEAYQCFQKAIQCKPDFPIPYNNMGILFLKIDKPDPAIYCLQQAIKLCPSYSDAYNNLGIAFVHQGKLPEAIRYFKKALKINPFDRKAKNNLEQAYRDIGLRE